MKGMLRIEEHYGEQQLRLYPEGNSKSRQTESKWLDTSLANLPKSELNGMKVEFDKRKGQYRNIRREGTSPVPSVAPNPNPSSSSAAMENTSNNLKNDQFLNPYNFVPAPSRSQEDSKSPLADSMPLGHDRLGHDRWSGRISVYMKTVTPLLVLDTESFTVNDKEHRTYSIKTKPNGEPHIAPTSIKGMLRAAYEVVTNSRFGIFTGHDDKLAYRMAASDGIKAIPARVTDDGKNIQLLGGTTAIGDQRGILHAAWLPRYRSGLTNLPEVPHGTRVNAWLEKIQHPRPLFAYWEVRAISPADEPSPERPSSAQNGELREITGWVFVTNKNMGNKHDERVFFSAGNRTSITKSLTEELKRYWRDVIKSYRDAHDDKELFDRRGNDRQQVGPDCYIDKEPGKTAWSPHIYEGRKNYPGNRYELEPGSLCYAHVDGQKNITALFPVSIARGLFQEAPDKLLCNDHKPADKLGKLSPADRVFGWVAQSGDGNRRDDYGAYRGNLRVGPVSCKQDGQEAIEEFDRPLPLGILAAPKPQQGRFYLENQGKDGATPITSDIEKSEFYSSGQTLRGRKVYLHHASLPDNYWDPAWNDKEPRGGRFQEYRLPDGESSKPDGGTSDQNRSITGWIRPDVSFQFTLDVKNLSDVELGALVWLLNLPEGHMHRLGYGKPLGFGSVQLSIDWQATKLCKGGEAKSTSEQTWSAYWKSLGDGSSGAGLSDDTLLPAEPEEAIEATVNSFKETVTGTGAGEEFEEVSFIRAFLAVSRGNSSMRVHYPRVRKDNSPPPPDPESFRWFTENEKSGNRKSLPLPSSDEGLPYYKVDGRSGSRQGGGRQGGGNSSNSNRQRSRNTRNG